MARAIYMEVDKRDVDKLQRTIKQIETYTNKQAQDLIRQTMFFAATSAANATRPRKGRDKNNNLRGGALRTKDMYRPLVALPSSMGHWYAEKEPSNAKPFKSNRRLNKRELSKQNLRRVTKAILVRNKRGKQYIPWNGKRNKRHPMFEIPNAGLGKLGWTWGLKKLNKKFSNNQKILARNKNVSRSLNKVIVKPLALEVWNKVWYVSKSSPGSARYGLNRAVNKLNGTYKKRVEKAIQKEIDRQR